MNKIGMAVHGAELTHPVIATLDHPLSRGPGKGVREEEKIFFVFHLLYGLP
jgi:hypothetical protein